ncbi:hypothetical protein L596_015713 [Steinernema carpocapsae]|uniref:Uncharacterized protein n=1 Tax=Steinernema carpocapsae TaxID=34508 RepID=A0A4U5NFU8_STECR|nr:hypothetical protein L596_015713 [Steinernema carpocapsae]
MSGGFQGYYPNNYVRSMYFAPAPTPQPTVQVFPEQQAAGAPTPLQVPVQMTPVVQEQRLQPQQQPSFGVAAAPSIRAPAPAPPARTVSVYSSYALPYGQQQVAGTIRRVPSSYQYEKPAPVQRQPSEIFRQENAARQAAREQAQRQVNEAKFAYEQAVLNLNQLSADQYQEEIQAIQREQQFAFQQEQLRLSQAPRRTPSIQGVQAQAPVAVAQAVPATPAEPVFSSYGYDMGSNKNYGRLQKQCVESAYYGLPNNMVPAYGRSRSPYPCRGRGASRQSSLNRRAGVSRSNSTVTAVEGVASRLLRLLTPVLFQVAQYKIAASPVAAYADREMEEAPRVAGPAVSEYHFDNLRGLTCAYQN